MSDFNYDLAFSRNLGWVSEWEQQALRGKRVAIAGMGGVGGMHLLTLARLGIGAFHIADMDSFELANFNRQIGANINTLDRPKVEVLAEMAREINPEVDIRIFGQGIDDDNIDAFLDGVDLFVDGFDFFVIDIRARVFARAHELAVPAITAGPIGMGAPYLIFMPGGMSFEAYFRLEGLPLEHKYVNFLAGLTPRSLHRSYLVDPTRLNLAAQRGPSTVMACQLCAGIVGVEALKILLRRGPVHAAPCYHLFDAYRGRYIRGRLAGGNRHPLQRLKLAMGYKMVARLPRNLPEEPARPNGTLEEILDLARWAPSGDNTQPWRFEILDERRLVIHGFDTRDHVVYDLEGHASQIALGGLLETVAIAARGRGLNCEVRRCQNVAAPRYRFEVTFQPDETLSPDPLEKAIRARSTQRRPFRSRPLRQQEKRALEESVGNGYRVLWLEGKETKRRVARLLFRNAYIRLTTPEAYTVHRDIIDWDAQTSQERLPDQSVGLDPLALRLMRWAMKSWKRVDFLNTWLGGTLLPRLQLDVLPALRCAAHFVIVAEQAPREVDDFVAAGRAMQRFWLTATRLGLQFQPEMTPLIFESYVRDAVPFSRKEQSLVQARVLAEELYGMIGRDSAERAVYMGRVGEGPAPTARSTRMPLQRLMQSGDCQIV